MTELEKFSSYILENIRPSDVNIDREAFKVQTCKFLEQTFFDVESIGKKMVKENELLLKRFETLKRMRDIAAEQKKEQKKVDLSSSEKNSVSTHIFCQSLLMYFVKA